MDIIAHIYNDLKEKFGVPRQSGLAPDLCGRIVFTPGFRNPDALRGLEKFSHIWLIWQFSLNGSRWLPTVRPPRLGGNQRVGVFACRSPFRPNPIGLSCVQLAGIELHGTEGPVIHVLGADLVNGTPLFDIKPYVPSSDCIPGARSGFIEELQEQLLQVDFLPAADERLSGESKKILTQLLRHDPRPRYHHDPERTYGMRFAKFNIRFIVFAGRVQVVDVDVHEDAQ